MVIGRHGIPGQLARGHVAQGAPLEEGLVPRPDLGVEVVRENPLRPENVTHMSVQVSSCY